LHALSRWEFSQHSMCPIVPGRPGHSETGLKVLPIGTAVGSNHLRASPKSSGRLSHGRKLEPGLKKLEPGLKQ
jgi:hypothetical protein